MLLIKFTKFLLIKIVIVFTFVELYEQLLSHPIAVISKLDNSGIN